MNYYERHLGDYARDTAHLSMLEHGAYNLLLDRCYATEAGIPGDQAHRIARARSRDEKAAVDAVLVEFFTLKDGVWTQGRVIEEIIKAQHRIETARSNGKTGGRPKKKPSGLSGDGAGGTEQKPSGLSVGSISETGSKALQSPISNLQTPDSRSNLLPSGRAISQPRAREDLRATGQDGTPAKIPDREHHDAFLRVQAAYPRAYGAVDWLTAERNCRRLVEAGTATWPDLEAAATRYAAFVAGGGLGNPRCVTHPQRFFDPDATAKPWAADWSTPQSATPERRRRSFAELLAEERAKNPDFDPDAPVQVTA